MILFLLLSFGTLSWSQYAADFGLVKVSSEYYDDEFEKLNPTEGTGVLIHDLSGKLFVLTPTHLSYGKKLKLIYGNSDLKIVSRVSDASIDLELIEVTPPQNYVALATYDDSNYFHLDSLQFPEAHHLAFINPKIGQFWGFQPSLHSPSFQGDFKLNSGINYPGSYKVLGPSRMILLSPWLGRVEDYSFSVSPAVEINPVKKWYRSQLSGFGEQFAAKLYPGASGSPVFSFHQIEHMRFEITLVGLALQSHLLFEHSTYSDAAALNYLMEKYQIGSRGRLSEIQWHMEGGRLYQKHPQVFSEKTFASPDGVVPPGSLTDIGRGTMIDVGKLSQEEVESIEFGLRYHGQDVIGFLLEITDAGRQALSSWPAKTTDATNHSLIPILANRAAIRLIESESRSSKPLFRVARLITHENLNWRELLQLKLGRPPAFQHNSQLFPVWNSDSENTGELRIQSNKMDIVLKDSNGILIDQISWNFDHGTPFLTKSDNYIYDLSGLLLINLATVTPSIWEHGGRNFCALLPNEGHKTMCQHARELGLISIVNKTAISPQIRWRPIDRSEIDRIMHF